MIPLPTLIITEKPSVAKAFADALSVPRKAAHWENDDFCIVNALGHLLENYDPEDYDPALKKWALETLPVIPDKVCFKAVEKTKEQLEVIKNCFNKRKNNWRLLLATDAEREGELIGAEILGYVGFTNYANARRFWVSEALTPDVIRKGIENAKPLADYSSYREQGFARQHADWLIGMNLTRLVTLKSGKLLHFGRVQTALLGAIYEREKSIAMFTAEPYYEIKAGLNKITGGSTPNVFSVKLINPDNKEYPARFSKNHPLFAEAEKLKDLFSEKSGPEGVITEMTKEKKTVQPPQLFNLTALQKEAHKEYGYSPEQTLEIAQALYEKHKCLSYPRTPSRVMGDENVDLVKSIYEKLKKEYIGTCWEQTIAGCFPELINRENKRLFNSAKLQDHHALIPLAPIPKDASKEEINICVMVLQRFFTTLKPPYVYNSVSIDVDISGLLFKGDGIEVLEPGWKYWHDDHADGEEGGEETENYAGLEKGASYPAAYIQTLDKKTEPEKHFTFASLLQLMENPRGGDGTHLSGLGTPATRGSILQKLVDRKYVLLKGKSILISDDGKFLIGNVLKNETLASFISIPETTRWEEQLHKDTGAFLNGIKNFVRNAVASTGMDMYRQEKKSLGKCPLCGGGVYEGRKNFYCGNYEKRNCNFAVWKEICGAIVSTADAQALLSGRQTKQKKCVSKAGKEF